MLSSSEIDWGAILGFMVVDNIYKIELLLIHLFLK